MIHDDDILYFLNDYIINNIENIDDVVCFNNSDINLKTKEIVFSYDENNEEELLTRTFRIKLEEIGD